MNPAIRGGSWFNIAVICRSASCVYDEPDYHDADLGFRIAKRRDILQVIRSGSWSIGADYCWAANRGSIEPVNRYDKLGFRIARRKI